MSENGGFIKELKTVGEAGPEIVVPDAGGYIQAPPPPPDWMRYPRSNYTPRACRMWIPLACAVLAGAIYAVLLAVFF